VAKLKTDLLDNRSLAILSETFKLLTYQTLVFGQPLNPGESGIFSLSHESLLQRDGVCRPRSAGTQRRGESHGGEVGSPLEGGGQEYEQASRRRASVHERGAATARRSSASQPVL